MHTRHDGSNLSFVSLMKRGALACWLVLLLVQPAPAAGQDEVSSDPATDESVFEALEFRSIGPFRGGRVTAVTGVRSAR